MIKPKASLFCFLFLFILVFSAVPVSAGINYEPIEENTPITSTPHEETISFYHEDTATNHGVRKNRSFSIRASKDGIVSILFANGAVSDGEKEYYNTLSASVYSDDGKKICGAQTDSQKSTSHIEFVCAYGGIYYIDLESRATAAGEYSCSFGVSLESNYHKNSIESFPHKASYTEKSSAAVSFSEMFSNAKYEASDSYKVSVFEINHKAGSVFSYKLNDDSAAVSLQAVLMSYDGSVYTPHPSHSGKDYSCGDAIELSYSAKSYLFVFSDGSFSLEADLLLHNDYKITELGESYSGKLDTSGAPLMYDQAKIDEIRADFPFSEIKNRNVIFFAFDCRQSSIVSFITDREEHKFLSLVSDELGLSHGSVYPMRDYGGYCSEISPCEYCYSASVCDGGRFYLCYTGTGIDTYVEVQSSPTLTSSFTAEQKYKPGDVIPTPTVQDLYSDADIYAKLGIDRILPDVMKISGYVMADEAGERYYFECGSDITVPNVDGKIKLYITVKCVYNSNTDNQEIKQHSFLIAEINSDRGFFAPLIDNVTEYLQNNRWLVYILCGVGIAGAGTGIFFAVVAIKKKKAAVTEAPDGTSEEKEEKEEENGESL